MSAVALVLAWAAAPAFGTRIAAVGTDAEPDPHAQLNRELSADSVMVQPVEREAFAGADCGDLTAANRVAQVRHRRPPFNPNRPVYVRRQSWWATPFMGLMVFTVLLLFIAWRSPSVPARGGSPPVPPPPSRAPNPRDVVCLACSRCNRVVDLPRHRLAHHVFCPRCGATLPRDV